MSTKSMLLRWSPRLLAILYALFLSLFTFDSWEGAGFWEGLVGFLVHLLPVYFVLFALVVGWRWPRAGGAAFLLLAAGFSLAFGWDEAAVLGMMAGPLVFIGLLFLLNWRPAPRPRFGA